MVLKIALVAFVALLGIAMCSTGWALPNDAATEPVADAGPAPAIARGARALERGTNVREVVIVARIAGMIDLGLGPFVERVLQTATEQRAAIVVLDIDTFGGRVDAAVVIRDHLLRSR